MVLGSTIILHEQPSLGESNPLRQDRNGQRYNQANHPADRVLRLGPAGL